jgi:hypothetical protein
MRLAFSLLATVILLVGCSEELSVEQQVIATIRNMEYAAEEGLHLEFMGYVAESFGAQQGSMDRREFHRFMIFQINQNRRLRAQLFPIYVNEISAVLASAKFRVLVTGGGGLLPENGQLFDVETRWSADGGDWQLERADWQAVNLPVL